MYVFCESSSCKFASFLSLEESHLSSMFVKTKVCLYLAEDLLGDSHFVFKCFGRSPTT